MCKMCHLLLAIKLPLGHTKLAAALGYVIWHYCNVAATASAEAIAATWAAAEQDPAWLQRQHGPLKCCLDM